MNIFEKIIDSNSFTHIDYMAEAALEDTTLPAADRACLEKILDARDLDERYALAHEHQGRPEKAKELRDWIIARNARKPHAPILAL